MTKPPFVQRQERRRQLERLRANRRKFEADIHEELIDFCNRISPEELADTVESTFVPGPGRLQ